MSFEKPILLICFALIACALASSQEAAEAARRLFEKRDYRGAVYMFDQAEIRDESSNADRAMHAIALSEVGKQQRAETVADELLAAAPDEPYAQYAAGIVSFNGGVYEQAVERFERAVLLSPDTEEYRQGLAAALVNAGLTHLMEGDFSSAKGYFSQALEIDSSYEPAIRNLSITLTELGEHEDAANMLGRWTIQDSVNPEPWYLLGQVKWSSGDLTGGIAAYRRAVRLGTDEPEAYLRVAAATEDVNLTHLAIGKAIQKAGTIEMMALQRLDQQEGSIDAETLRSMSSFADLLSGPRALLAEGLELLQKLRPDEGFRQDIDMLIEWYPHSVELKVALAAHHFGRGDTDEALRIWESVLIVSPGLATAHLGMGRCFQRLDFFDKAVVSYRRALGLDPENAEIYAALHDVYRAAGHVADLQVILAERAIIDAWNPVLLEELMALERDLGMDESADSRQEKLQEIRAIEG